MTSAVNPMKEYVDHEVSNEDAKTEKYVERHLCLPKTHADLQQPDFSIEERALKSPVDID
jgi:hypothetical protein